MITANDFPSLYLDEAVHALVKAGLSHNQAEEGMAWLARQGALVADMLPCETWRHPQQPMDGRRPPIIDVSTSSMFVVVHDGQSISTGWVLFRAPTDALPAVVQHFAASQPLQLTANAIAAAAAARTSAAIALRNSEAPSNDSAPVVRPGVQSIAEKKAEEACGGWLATLAADGFKPAGNDDSGPKDALFQEAERRFPGLSRAAFNRQWATHAPPEWTAKGRRSNEDANTNS